MYNDSYGVSNDTAICFGDSVQVFAYGGISYNWAPMSVVSNPAQSNSFVTPSVNTNLIVSMMTPNGCLVSDSVLVSVDRNFINQQVGLFFVLLNVLDSLLQF